MTKKELEKEINDLKVKIALLEARPQIFCAGHYCNCHQHISTTPYWPNTSPWYTGPTWISTSPTAICGITTSGNTEILSRAKN